MRHRVIKKRLSRDTDHMDSLLKNLSAQLILKEKIETTLAKAKMLRPHVEKMITYASLAVKSGDKIKKFNAVKSLNNKIALQDATKKLINEIAERFAGTPGGYTRIVRVPNRDGDNAEMARIEFTKTAPKKTKETKAKTVKKVEEVKDEQ